MDNKKPKFETLTGIRGLAAALVVINHYFVWAAPVNTDHLPGWFAYGSGGGYGAMTLFFILSGFVIAYNYNHFEWKRHPFYSTARFFAYRIARLYPLFLLFTLLLIWSRADLFTPQVLLNPNDPVMSEIFQHLTLTQTWHPHFTQDGPTTVNSYFHVSWSISAELFLYVSFAVMMLIAARFSTSAFSLKSLFCYGAIAIAILALWRFEERRFFVYVPVWFYGKWLFFLSPYYRAIEFCAGMFAYWIIAHDNYALSHLLQRWSSLGIFLLLLPVMGKFFTPSPDNLFPKELMVVGMLLNIAGAFLLVLSCTQINLASKFLSSKLLVQLGEISYSLYLFHFIIPHFTIRNYGASRFGTEAFIVFMINFALSCGFAVALAYGLYRFVEVPGRRIVRALFQRFIPEPKGFNDGGI